LGFESLRGNILSTNGTINKDYDLATFGIIPPEPPRIFNLANCSPALVVSVNRVLTSMGPTAMIYETLRTDARQKWLAGFGVNYDDGRGIVTHAQSAQYGWHFFGLAVDIIHRDHEWNASEAWWEELAETYAYNGLTAGKRWRMADKPHGQWGKCRTTPSDNARELYLQGGNHAVWTAVGAL
jgi:hypothetical protein